MYVRAANMYKMAKNWCGKNNTEKNDAMNVPLLGQFTFVLRNNFFLSAAGNAFSQAAHLHLQMQSKHDAATNFIDAGNAFKKADPQGNHYSPPPAGIHAFTALFTALPAVLLEHGDVDN